MADAEDLKSLSWIPASPCHHINSYIINQLVRDTLAYSVSVLGKLGKNWAKNECFETGNLRKNSRDLRG